MNSNPPKNQTEALGLLTRKGELVAFRGTVGVKLLVLVQAVREKQLPPQLRVL